jgi:3-oxoacyl-[acyl-carrier-protein] synthase-3
MAVALPQNKELNKNLTGFKSEELEQLIALTGINQRRIATDKLSLAELSCIASERLLQELNWEKESIHFLVLVSQTPDYYIPGTATQVQNKLGLSKNCMCIDLNQGCAGYVYGLSVLSSLLAHASGGRGLLLVGDTLSKRLKEGDRATVPLFSDALSVTALEQDTTATPMLFNLQSDGEKFQAILQDKDGFLSMNGREIFDFGLREVLPNVRELLNVAGLSEESIDAFVFHQANRLLNEGLRRKLKLPLEKVPYTLAEYGNTSSASIPLTLLQYLKENKCPSQQFLLAGFGVGLSWASAIVNISDIVCPDLIEVEA